MTATVRGISLQDRDGSVDEEGVKEYTVTYKVQTDDKRDGQIAVLNAFGIPNIGDIYTSGNEFELTSVVVGKTATPVDAFEWEVEVKYTNDLSEEPIGFKDNPLNEPAEISYGFQNRRILVPGSYNDPLGPPGDKGWQQGIFAPNGELFDPQPEAEISEPVLTIKRNVEDGIITGKDLMEMANCVNNDTWEDAEPRQLKLNAPQANRRWHKQIGFYWEITYSIAYRWETWDLQVLNQGTYYFSGGKPTSVWSTTVNRLAKTDVTGMPIVVNLTTNGDVNTSATPTYTRIRFYREISFAGLNLL